MGTFLFHDVVFGPVKSRRLGISLGINLLPIDSKLCNFNCIYCECGWTISEKGVKKQFQPRNTVKQLLEQKLIEMSQKGEKPDVITFAGNGEPTLHPDFAGIIEDTIEVRDKLSPEARIAVLSNATQLHRQKVIDALQKIEDPILKLDSAFPSTLMLLNCPNCYFDEKEIINNFRKFKGNFILQTMFLKGEYKKQIIDNTTEKEVSAWIEIIKKVKPRKVMIYTIARDTPSSNLQKIEIQTLQKIAERVNGLGIETSVSG
ncbi:MAG: radical SAM protein [Bacteroidales bacterium]|nr:radical SAM protein [Bacteroidales bacterium]